jgi:hypothetical protein
VAVEVQVPVPALRAARLEGVHTVLVRVTSHSGYREIDERYRTGATFRPRCPAGPCDVRLVGLVDRGFRTVLRRRGATYAGSARGRFNVRCGDVETISEVALELRVVRARVVAGEWVATRLEGTMVRAEAAQLGCVASRAEMDLRARLLT